VISARGAGTDGGWKVSIWYHGTDEKAAASIIKTGFRVGTYFGEALQDALTFGGEHVFEVELDDSKINKGAHPEDDWQLHTLEHIPADRIVGYKVYAVEKRFENQELRSQLATKSLAAAKERQVYSIPSPARKGE
jgi:hypothetical protein